MIDSETLFLLDTNLTTLRSVRELPKNRLDALKNLRECLNQVEKILVASERQLLEDTKKEGPILSTISSLTSKLENWIVHAHVTVKSEIKSWDMSRTCGQLFHLTLKDTSGEIRCTVFDDGVEKFYHLFQVGREYSISNGKIRKKPDYTFEMSLNGTSIVIPLVEGKTKKTSESAPTTPRVGFDINPPRSILKVPIEPMSAGTNRTKPLRSILKTSQPSHEDDPPTTALTALALDPFGSDGDDDDLQPTSALRSILKTTSTNATVLHDDDLPPVPTYDNNDNKELPDISSTTAYGDTTGIDEELWPNAVRDSPDLGTVNVPVVEVHHDKGNETENIPELWKETEKLSEFTEDTTKGSEESKPQFNLRRYFS